MFAQQMSTEQCNSTYTYTTIGNYTNNLNNYYEQLVRGLQWVIEKMLLLSI